MWLVYERLTPLSGGLGFWVCVYVAFVGIAWFVAREQRGPVVARDQVARIVVWTGGVGLIVPLVAHRRRRDRTRATTRCARISSRRTGSLGRADPAKEGGASGAIVGTLEQVGLAMLISVPLGVTTAGVPQRDRRVAGAAGAHDRRRDERDPVDRRRPLHLRRGHRAVSLAPRRIHRRARVVGADAADRHPHREVVLRLVPGGLREASLALGSTEWRTTRHVVLPTSQSGVVTAVILGVARVIGETAPLLLTLGATKVFNDNPFNHNPQDSLSVMVYQQFRLAQPNTIPRAWTGALVLLALVLVLFVTARIVGGQGPGHIGRIRRLRLARKGLA